MPTTLVSSLPPGTTFQFRSKDPDDTTQWIGNLESPICSYNIARSYMNPAAYNEAVIMVDNTVPSDVTLLNYFILTVANNSEEPTLQVFAQEWILPGSLSVISSVNTVKLIVKDPLNDPQAIVSLLASGGYYSTITS